MPSSSDTTTALWWRGVELWYNQQDYHGAMQVWWEAVAACVSNDGELQLTLKRSSSTSPMAPLCLFLAGCYLDAQDFERARRLLVTCLVIGDNSLAERAVVEYTASVMEDASHPNPAATARKAVQWAMNHGIGPWQSVYQRPGYFIPNIASRPFYPRDLHPDGCRQLEAHWREIVYEFEKLRLQQAQWPAVGAGDHRDGAGAHDGSVVDGQWHEWVLFGSGARPEAAPVTARLVQTYIPDAVSLAQVGGGEVIFSVLAPHTHIQPHCASTNVRLTAHLGLQIPHQARIRVADTWHSWSQGSMLVFDDSYEHEVVNDSDEPRAVLLLRFWHFNLARHERTQALEHAMDAKHVDQLQRYNSPLPTPNTAVEERGLECTRCVQCGRTGFETLRLANGDQQHTKWVCTCGRPLGY